MGERGPYVGRFRWRERFAAPYVPLLVDTVDARGRGIHVARLEEYAASAGGFRGANFIELLGIDGELWKMPRKCAGAVYRAAHFCFFGHFCALVSFCLVLKKFRRAPVVSFSFLALCDSVVSFVVFSSFCFLRSVLPFPH